MGKANGTASCGPQLLEPRRPMSLLRAGKSGLGRPRLIQTHGVFWRWLLLGSFVNASCPLAGTFNSVSYLLILYEIRFSIPLTGTLPSAASGASLCHI